MIWGGALIWQGNNSPPSSLFVSRLLSFFWVTNECSIDTTLCLTLEDSVHSNYTSALLTGFYFFSKNPFKSLRLSHQLPFLCPCFCCPINNACLALFRKAGVIVIRSTVGGFLGTFKLSMWQLFSYFLKMGMLSPLLVSDQYGINWYCLTFYPLYSLQNIHPTFRSTLGIYSLIIYT